jgi:hypothetical protein
MIQVSKLTTIAAMVFAIAGTTVSFAECSKPAEEKKEETTEAAATTETEATATEATATAAK